MGYAVNNSVVPEFTGLDEAAKDEGRCRPDVRGALGSLFPESPDSAPLACFHPIWRLLPAVAACYRSIHAVPAPRAGVPTVRGVRSSHSVRLRPFHLPRERGTCPGCAAAGNARR